MSRVDKLLSAMRVTENIRNIAVCAHIDHGKTTFCDGLLAGAGMMSEELAGQSRQLDYRADEIERGITIDAACTSMLHSIDSKDIVVNLIDTPGHVDFGGDVTRAMRAVDGCIVLVDAVEGMMPQTETVLRQALAAGVRPILFINKVDRLIRELRYSPAQMQERFGSIIVSVNRLIEDNAPQQFKRAWRVDVTLGSVLFGSAVHAWALSLSVIKEKSISLQHIIDVYERGEDEIKKLRRIVPSHSCVIAAVHSLLPSPATAAAYRIPIFWKGDLASAAGASLSSSDIAGPTIFVASKVEIDGGMEITTGRIFSGTIRKGDVLSNLRNGTDQKISQLYIRNGSKKEQVEELFAGCIVTLSGISVRAGDTLSSIGVEPFSSVEHMFEQVLTKAIEPQRPADLPLLTTALEQMQKEDPGLIVDVNKETGEYLISGYGELHLEVIENRIRDVKKIAVHTSAPLVVHREQVSMLAEHTLQSPLDNSRVTIEVAPLSQTLLSSISSLPNGRVADSQSNLAGVFRSNALFSRFKITDSLFDAFSDIMRRGPLCAEPCSQLQVTIKILEGENPGVVYPLFKEALRQAILSAQPELFAPMQELQIEAPSDMIGAVTTLVSSRKGNVFDIVQDEHRAIVHCTLPVTQSLGLTSELRGVTNGRGVSSIRRLFYEKLESKEQAKVVRKLLEQKGMIR